ncbi:TIGR01777 family oxidoreductase [Halioglobus sp.]|nr:TIGR01777 family oxidoreductase [Halioglobus sp.]
MTESRRLLVTGGTGFIGKVLCRRLVQCGYRVTVLTRNRSAASQALALSGIDFVESLGELEASEHWFGVVNLAGQPLDSGRWNSERKVEFRSSRINLTKTLVSWMSELDKSPEVFVSASATGWYGHWHDELLDEDSGCNTGYAQHLCGDWERAAREGLPKDCRGCQLRIGIVLGPGGGPLSAMLTPARLGLGGAMGTGEQWWSWIQIEDLVRLICFLLEEEGIEGAVNGTAPNPVRQRQFAKILGGVLRRPAFMPLPGYVVSLVLGEFADEILLRGQRVLPARALAAGFIFNYPELEGALKSSVGMPR